MWPTPQWFQTLAVLAAIGLGGVANFWLNRTVHCTIMSPVFLIAAALLLADASMRGLVWALVLMGTGIALLVEYRYAPQR